jgi:hypothetical protein
MKLEFDFKTKVKYSVEVDGGDTQTHEDVLDDVYYYEDMTVGHDVDLYSDDILELLKDAIEIAYLIDESDIVLKEFDLKADYEHRTLEIKGFLECDLLGNPVLENTKVIERLDKRLVKLLNKNQCFLNFEQLYGLGGIDLDTVDVHVECDEDTVEYLYGLES